MRIDDSIAALSSALNDIGFGPLQPPKDLTLLAEIDAAIAPLTVPAELRRFWETVDVYAGGIQTLDDLSWPSLHDMPGAFEDWETSRGDQPLISPAALFPIAYSSQLVVAMELDDPRHGPGGALFGYDLVGTEFALEYLSLSDWLDEMTVDVRGGKFGIRTLHGQDYLHRIVWDDNIEPRAVPPHPEYGEAVVFSREDSGTWPLHWQRSA